MRFSDDQTARGLATTCRNGEYALTIARLSHVTLARQAHVIDLLLGYLDADQQATFRRYWDAHQQERDA